MSFAIRKSICWRGVLTLALASLCDVAYTQTPSWGLRDGDHVVFYGDSITEQRFYTWWTELYAVTRFPGQHVKFWNAGVGGDRVSGGFGGDVDSRLQRDVFAHHPTVVTIMLGMNDGHYSPLTPQIETTYAEGYTHILRSVRERTPSARILSIGPSPYDEVTRLAPLFPGGYNSSLIKFAAIDRKLATGNGAEFIDANAPFVDALGRAAKENVLAAQMLVPDRVHPDLSAHLLIAMAVLRAWHAPAIVSTTHLDAVRLTTESSQRVKVTALIRTDRGLTWHSLEEALPMPLGYSHATLAFMKRIAPVVEELNQEPLVITSLPEGVYDLKIDDVGLGSFTASELSVGINLAEMDTPMRRQAQNVEWTVRDKGDLQFVRSRILIRKSSPDAAAALDKAEEQIQETIWHDAEPMEHTFALTKQKN